MHRYQPTVQRVRKVGLMKRTCLTTIASFTAHRDYIKIKPTINAIPARHHPVLTAPTTLLDAKVVILLQDMYGTIINAITNAQHRHSLMAFDV